MEAGNTGNHSSRNHNQNDIDNLHKRQPELFETLDPYPVDADKIEREIERIEAEKVVPTTPRSSPVKQRKTKVSDDPYDIECPDTPRKLKNQIEPEEVHHVRTDAIVLEDYEDPYYEEELSSE